jgi:hypothetical protein
MTDQAGTRRLDSQGRQTNARIAYVAQFLEKGIGEDDRPGCTGRHPED